MRVIVIDLETTGLDLEHDEILQISIIDGNYQVLLNTLCKPENKTEWKQAEAVHGITPALVEDKLPFRSYIEQVKNIISETDRIVVYNGKGFDLQLLMRYGIEIDFSIVYDLMLEVDAVYHQWFKLVDLAYMYEYEFNAHDSLEDVKATLHCYYKFRTEKNNLFLNNRSMDFIINHSGKKDKALELSKTVKNLKVTYMLYSNHIGIETKIKNYNVNLLFNKDNNLVDSICECLDCRDGGNRLCKHVVASLILLKNQYASPYQDAKKITSELIRNGATAKSNQEE